MTDLKLADIAKAALDAAIKALDIEVDWCGCCDCESYWHRDADIRPGKIRDKVEAKIAEAIRCVVAGVPIPEDPDPFEEDDYEDDDFEPAPRDRSIIFSDQPATLTEAEKLFVKSVRARNGQ